ncbi:DsbA family protein [Thalassotalea euphylliae]|uniref:DsbA family protein n=1 Tax=Thalassotalea euphylliae TaxID=1655234 RepID=UPI003627CE24
MKKSIQPYVLKLLSSDTLKYLRRRIHAVSRFLMGDVPTINVFLRVDDPYSYLLVQALPSLAKRFDVAFKFVVITDIDEAMYPRPDLLQQYALKDVLNLAELYDMDFPMHAAIALDNKARMQLFAERLASIQDSPKFIVQARYLLRAFWHNEIFEDLAPLDIEAAKFRLKQNHLEMAKKGHYLGAMLYFEGEWYWGLDRLDHLERRLIEQKLSKSSNELVLFNLTYKGFCANRQTYLAEPQPLTLFWSARSPYSYIALERAVQLAAHYKLRLVIKPVMPMVMRGMQVPDTKKFYIFQDTKREANKLGLSYGFVADPLGAAVERCYALVEYAESENKLIEFLLSFARGVNTEGIRADTDKGLEKIVSRCGLDWQVAKTKLDNTAWYSMTENNMDELNALGYWGVPVIRYGNMHFWGQDRLKILENHIAEQL